MKLYTLDNQLIKETDYIPDNFTGIVNWDDELKEWYKNGSLHREDGPACVYKSAELWYINGLRHRIGGPAYESPTKKLYYINEEEITEEQHNLLFMVMKLKGLL